MVAYCGRCKRRKVVSFEIPEEVKRSLLLYRQYWEQASRRMMTEWGPGCSADGACNFTFWTR
jgi:hypothetical protein